MRLECLDGVVSVAHTCAARCAGAGAAVSVAFGGLASSLAVAGDGLDHGQSASWRCAEHFEGAIGELGLLCVGGVASAFGSCSTPAACASATAVWRRASPAVVCAGVACFLVALLLWAKARRQRRRAVVKLRPAPAAAEPPDGAFTTILPPLETETPRRTCPKGHALRALPPSGSGWSCSGMDLPGGCLSGITGFCQTSGMGQFRCEPCDYDLCDACCRREDDELEDDDAHLTRPPEAEPEAPRLRVELVRGGQRPLDLVFLLDSSVSVGAENFPKAVAFLEAVVRELEIPPVEAGVLLFNHTFTEASPLTSSREALQRSLRSIAFSPGERKLAAPLRHARAMLEARSDPLSGRASKKVVVIVARGDPADLRETEREATDLKDRGAQLVVLQVGSGAQLRLLSSMASEPAEDHVLELQNYDELAGAAPRLLRRVVDVSLWLRRAKCEVDMDAYQVVQDLSDEEGHELMVPGWERTEAHGGRWAWDDRGGGKVLDPQLVRWDPSFPKAPGQAAARLALPPPAPAGRDAGIDTGDLRNPSALVGTDPMVKVCLEPWRHAELDLRGSHLSNATCLTQVFFKSGE